MGRNRGQPKHTLHTLSRERLRPEDFAKLDQEFSGGSDRAVALIACALVDTSLVNALSSRFSSNVSVDSMFYGQAAVLGSLSSRTKMGLAIGVFGPKVADILDAVREIRNAFAHAARPIDFSHELIVKHCRRIPPVNITEQTKHLIKTDRDRYVAVCIDLAKQLDAYAGRHGGSQLQVGFEINVVEGSGDKPQ